MKKMIEIVVLCVKIYCLKKQAEKAEKEFSQLPESLPYAEWRVYHLKKWNTRNMVTAEKDQLYHKIRQW